MNLIATIEVAGALLILAAFAASQLRRLDPHSLPYLILNVVGAGILAVVAALGRSWGFLLLEGTWTIVSAVSLVNELRRPRPPGGTGGNAATRRRAARTAPPPTRPV